MKNNKLLFLFGLLLMLIPYVFWLLLGEESFVVIHDNLDSELVYIIKILEERATFSFDSEASINGIMNGLPRGLLRSGLSFTFILFALLSPVYAYIVNHLFVHIIGYIGMFLLVKRFFIKDNNWLVLLISLCFGFLPYYHIQYGISISGQPILLFAFLNVLYNKQKWYDWLIIVLFPFYSFLIVTLPFIIPFLVCIGIGYTRKHSFSKKYFLAILLICIVNVIVEAQLIYTTFFNPDIISHRLEWDILKPSIENVIKQVSNYLKETQYHSGSLDVRPIIALFFVGLLFLKLKFKSEIKYLSYSIVFIILWTAFNPYLVYTFRDINIFTSFNSSRFYFLLPFFWLLLFAVLLNKLSTKLYLAKLIGIALLLFSLYKIIDENTEYTNNLKAYFGTDLKGPNFNEFYAEDLFEEIRTYLGKDEVMDYNFLNLGIFPSIAQYNGFRTLDSYQNNYQLSYKHQFEQIISNELDKDDKIRSYFDNWGNRCYLFSSELGRKYMFPKKTNTKVKNLEINSIEFKKMNGKYLISSVPIVNHKTINFDFLKSFSNSKSYWKLYLYKVRDDG